MYCVYKHTCPNGKSYIGITKQKTWERWGRGSGYATQFFGKAVAKYGWDNITHEILFDGLTLEEANAKESEMIKKYDTHNPQKGYNLTDGGDGIKGYVATEEAKKAMSERAKRMWADPDKRKYLENHLREISQKNKGRKQSEEHKKKVAEFHSIKVDQYSMDGIFITTHNSLMDAARSFGLLENTLLVRCCQGKRKSAYGFIWKYHGEELTKEEIAYRNSRKERIVPVVMCDGEWNEIKTFPNAITAQKELGISNRGIWSACQTGRMCKGYRWRYAD